MRYLHLALCEACGKEFHVRNTSPNAPKYCSQACRRQGIARKRNRTVPDQRISDPWQPEADPAQLQLEGAA